MKLDKVERIIIVIRVINFAISCSSRYINIYIYIRLSVIIVHSNMNYLLNDIRIMITHYY